MNVINQVRQELQEVLILKRGGMQALFNPLLYKGANTRIVEELSFIEWVHPTE
jgi:hypothetical protein